VCFSIDFLVELDRILVEDLWRNPVQNLLKKRFSSKETPFE